MNTLTEVCTFNANFYEVCALANNFRSWIEVNSKESEFMFLKADKSNFHVRLCGIVEPLLQKVPPMFLIHALEVIPPLSPVQTTLVASELTVEAGSVSWVKKIVISDEVIMKT